MLFITLVFSPLVKAETADKSTENLKDMSDPLAVYTRGGIGFSDRGINIKVGIQYDSGKENENVMNVFEFKGIGGDELGWAGSDKRSDSMDSFRYRNFTLNKADARGTQIDITYDFHSDSGIASFSVLQGLPKWHGFNFYPLLGGGMAYAKDAIQDDGTTDSGYSLPGGLAVVGFYGKYTVNDKVWINYNPFWSVGLFGTDMFMDHGFEGDSSVLTHEATLSYKLNPRSNIRLYANWSENVDISDGAHRIEYNYQF